jgi:hypothetical protein
MKKLFLFLFLAAGCYSLIAQNFILDKRSKIKKNMEKYYAENNRKYSFSETDNKVTYVLNDSLTLPATSVFYFNNRNSCIKQEVIFSCDSCLQKAITGSLNNKFTKWEKVGVESYYTGFPYNILMEPIKENGQFMMRYTHLSRKALKNLDKE